MSPSHTTDQHGHTGGESQWGEYDGSSTFDDLEGPSDDQLLAQEQQPRKHSPRRALVVLVGEAGDPSAGDVDRLVTELLSEDGFTVDAVVRVKSKKRQIRQVIETAVVGGADLVITVGGTGVGPRDKTPEATREMLDKLIPGIAQALRSSGLACGATDAAVSRGIAGISGVTVIVNLAASRPAIRDGMATLSPLAHHVINELRQW